MKRVKVDVLIKQLEKARDKYIQEHGQDPYIWSIRPSEGEIELSHDMTKMRGGFKAKTVEVYDIEELSDL